MGSSAPEVMQKPFDNYIAGEWIAGASVTANRNPSNLADVVGEYAQADAGQAKAAIAAAARAFPAWAQGSIQERANSLDRIGTEILARKDELGRLLSREEGKTLAEGVGEVVRAGQIFSFFAGEVVRAAGEKLPSVRPGVEIEVTREPLGVIGIITPWNFPIAIPAWKIAPALAYGNTVVFKPADLVPGCALGARRDHRARRAAGGRVQPGDGPRVGRRRGAGQRPGRGRDQLHRLGGTGRGIAAKAIARMAKIQLEMGGKNPLIVLDDADLPTAVNVAVQGAYYSTGQRCTASSRLIVSAGIHDRFVAAVADKLRTLKVDDALAPGTDIGPVVDQSQLDIDLSYLDLGRKEGARLRPRRRAAAARQRGLLSCAGAVHRGHQRHAHLPRGDLRAGRRGDPRQGLRRGAGASPTPPSSACRRGS